MRIKIFLLIVVLQFTVFQSSLISAEQESAIETANREAREQAAQNQPTQTPQPAEQTQIDSIEILNEILNIFKTGKIYALWNLNVFDFYDELNEQYNTPLRRKIFKKTEEYLKKLNELKKTKSLIFTTELMQECRNNGTYDLEKKKIIFPVYHRDFAPPPGYVLRDYHPVLKNLMPIKTIEWDPIYESTILSVNISLNIPMDIRYGYEDHANPSFAIKKIFLSLSFPCNEQLAERIESKGKLRIFFKINDLKTVTVNARDFPDYQHPEGGVFIGHFYTTIANRIEVIDKETNEVLFKKKF